MTSGRAHPLLPVLAVPRAVNAWLVFVYTFRQKDAVLATIWGFEWRLNEA